MKPSFSFKKELYRKAFHISGLVFLLFFYALNYQKEKILFFWLFIIFIFNFLEILRLTGIFSFLNSYFSLAMRPSEGYKFLSTFYYFWGLALSYLFYPPHIANICLLVLTLADGISGLFPKRNLHSLSFFLITLIILSRFFPLSPLLILKSFILTLCERLIPLDDNLTIPLLTGFLIQVFY